MAEQPSIRKPSHTIGLVGVRDHKGSLYDNVSYIVRTLEHHIAINRIDIRQLAIVTGGGRGVEAIVVKWCEAKNVSFRKIPPNIQEFGTKKAFVVRNNHVVTQADELVMFWDGSIDLLTDSIMTAMHLNKVATVYPVI